MCSEKENQLESTLDSFVNATFVIGTISSVEEFMDKDLMVYGTAPDEKVFGKDGFKWMVERQRQELKGPSPEIKRKPVLRKIFGQGNSALNVEEVIMKVKDEDGTYIFTLRMTTVFEYDGKKWRILHIHGSTIDTNIQKGSAWPIEEYKRKNAELQLLVKEKTADLEQSLIDLKATQKQLIQQEKLASLGQLTAGIAHEIKNPLNFVTNFSELNIELLQEIKELKARNKDERDEQLEGEILKDIEQNLIKINQHGTRADRIVKSMLQHSRGGSGKMEPTDLNALVRDYVNLAYHGMRAGKKVIDVKIVLLLDDKLGKVPLIEEDFSRVIVNICNNAFDAMKEKQTFGSKPPSVCSDYAPLLTVRTLRNKKNIILEIEDNGSGIPDEIKDNILQPFFTTKKGTEGTGLGLSITNSIVKAHGGDLVINTHLGNGSLLSILLPIKPSKN